MPVKQYDEWVEILENKKVNDKYYKLTFRSPNLSRNVLPGQFINVLLGDSGGPFLRRPFSYFRIRGNSVEVLYEILGRGTSLLAEKNKGDRLKVMGPLGKPFSQKVKGSKRILVAGGVGVPPLIFLAEKTKVDYLLIGTKSKGEMLPASERKKVKAKIFYSTNDGSYGKKGYITSVLEEVLDKEQNENCYIQTCGPTPMMKAVIDLANERGVPGEASLDEDMACGVGACLGCMVKTHQGWKPSCVEGPVFRFECLAEDWAHV